MEYMSIADERRLQERCASFNRRGIEGVRVRICNREKVDAFLKDRRRIKGVGRLHKVRRENGRGRDCCSEEGIRVGNERRLESDRAPRYGRREKGFLCAEDRRLGNRYRTRNDENRIDRIWALEKVWRDNNRAAAHERRIEVVPLAHEGWG